MFSRPTLSVTIKHPMTTTPVVTDPLATTTPVVTDPLVTITSLMTQCIMVCTTVGATGVAAPRLVHQCWCNGFAAPRLVH